MELLINDYGHDEIIDQIPEKIVERTERMIEFPFFQYSFFFLFRSLFHLFAPRLFSSQMLIIIQVCVRVCVCSWQLCCNSASPKHVGLTSTITLSFNVCERQKLNSLPSLSDSLKLYRRILPFINERRVQLKWASLQAPGASHWIKQQQASEPPLPRSSIKPLFIRLPSLILFLTAQGGILKHSVDVFSCY